MGRAGAAQVFGSLGCGVRIPGAPHSFLLGFVLFGLGTAKSLFATSSNSSNGVGSGFIFSLATFFPRELNGPPLVSLLLVYHR